MSFSTKDLPLLTRPPASPRKARKAGGTPTVPAFQKHVRLTLPYPPSVNRAYRVFRGRSILSREGRAYKANVAKLLKTRVVELGEGAEPLVGEVLLMLTFYRPAKRGDLDNLLKLSLDALKGVAFHDDRQVRRIVTERIDDQSDAPRVEVIAVPFNNDAGMGRLDQ